jgi:hypothetical protein
VLAISTTTQLARRSMSRRSDHEVFPPWELTNTRRRWSGDRPRGCGGEFYFVTRFLSGLCLGLAPRLQWAADSIKSTGRRGRGCKGQCLHRGYQDRQVVMVPASGAQTTVVKWSPSAARRGFGCCAECFQCGFPQRQGSGGSAGGGAQTTVGSGLNKPSGVAWMLEGMFSFWERFRHWKL